MESEKRPPSTVAPGQKPASDVVMDILAALDDFEDGLTVFGEQTIETREDFHD